MPDEDKSFGGSLVLNLRIKCRHVKTLWFLLRSFGLLHICKLICQQQKQLNSNFVDKSKFVCSQIVYVAVQGQQQSNKFKLSMWDALFTQDTYVTSVTEEQSAPVTVLDKNLTPYSYKYACLIML